MIGNKKPQKKWFIARRGSYLPASAAGLAIYLTYTVYILALSLAWYQRGHAAWEFLTVVIPLCVLAAALTQYAASRHSR